MPGQRERGAGEHRGDHPGRALVQREPDQRRRPRRRARARCRRCAARCGRPSRPSSRVPAASDRARGRARATKRRRLRTPTPRRGRLPGRSGVAEPPGQHDQHDSAGDRGGDAGGDRRSPRSAPNSARTHGVGERPPPARRPGRTPGSARRAGSAPARHRPSSRTMTGAHSPTKPIGPARVTAAAVSTTASTMPMTRVERTGHAEHGGGVVAQRQQVEPPGQQQAAQPVAATHHRRRLQERGRGRAGSASRCPRRTGWSSPRLNRMSRVAVADCRASATAEPASTSRVVEVPAPPARPSTSAAAASPPTNATTPGRPQRDGQPERGHRDDRQVGPGRSPRGCPARPARCAPATASSAPATPRANPTAMPAASRGIREPTQDLAGWTRPWRRCRRSASAEQVAEPDAGGALGQVPAGDQHAARRRAASSTRPRRARRRRRPARRPAAARLRRAAPGLGELRRPTVRLGHRPTQPVSSVDVGVEHLLRGPRTAERPDAGAGTRATLPSTTAGAPSRSRSSPARRSRRRPGPSVPV